MGFVPKDLYIVVFRFLDVKSICRCRQVCRAFLKAIPDDMFCYGNALVEITSWRNEAFALAKISEQAERNKEMMQSMRFVAQCAIKTSRKLSLEEKNLLSLAHSSSIGERRASYRILCSVREKEKSNGKSTHTSSKMIAVVKKEILALR